jgi:carboxypeptidase Q
MFRKLLLPILTVGLVTSVVTGQGQAPAGNQTLTVWAPMTVTPEKIDVDINAKIRAEGMERSKIQWIEHYLTDIYGPRVTGSPNHENAGKWAIKTMESWGLKNGKMEPWDWGHEGWLNERAIGHIISPVKDKLEFEVLAWTPSTKGTVTAEAVNIVPPVNPTAEQMTRYITEVTPKVRNGIVLMGEWRQVPVDFNPPAKRQDDEAMRRSYAPPDPNAPPPAGRGAGRGNAGGGGAGRGRGAAPASEGGALTPQQVTQKINEMLAANPPALRINDAARAHGQIVAFNAPGYDSSKAIPTVVMRSEDYGRIARILADGTAVTLEFTIVNKTYPEGKTSYNATAEIVGTDKAAEVVMLGGHLDSWQSATGATDNAIGCAIMMEAVRILQAIGVKPRRTIRVALWGGEEEGLLGSKAYVAQHFGTAEAPKPEFAKLNSYWNIDSGTGRVRGAGVFGPPEAGVILAQILKPFEDFGIYGASTTTSRATGGTDSTSFNAAGLPGIGGRQDPIEYGSHTHHTNLDTYERIVWEDVMKDAIVTASLVYHLAMRDQMLPRFAPDKMPAPITGRGGH